MILTMICNKRAETDLLVPYIDKPVYVRGYSWSKSFDGWTVLYEDEGCLRFDYRGKSYNAAGFLPSRFTLRTDPKIRNAFYLIDDA